MASTKHNLFIHHANLFHPKAQSLCHLSHSSENGFIAATRKLVDQEGIDSKLTLIEFYKIDSDRAPLLTQTIVEYEQITGIAWISADQLLSVSKQQTISIYSIKHGLKTSTTITDYGPILCMKYSSSNGLLVTGTEYGYAVAYHIDAENETIEPVNKMVKVTDAIRSMDFAMRPRERGNVKPLTKQVKSSAGKRKRSDSSDESGDNDNDDDDNDINEGYLHSVDITIYGASKGEVIAWDYHRRIIMETMRIGDEGCTVLTVISFQNGDIIIGDSTGTVSIFDHNSFTCRQTINLLQSGVSCLALSPKERRILISGQDPTIYCMKRDRAVSDEFVVFEKIEFHTYPVNSIVFVSRRKFFTGSADGFMARFRLSGKASELRLEKHITLPSYSGNVKFSNREMMIQYDRSLVIWRLPKESNSSLDDRSELKPIKLILIKARAYIHSSTFSADWISYSTSKGLHLFKRCGKSLISYKPDKRLAHCCTQQICSNDRYLVAAIQRNLYIIDLSKQSDDSESDSPPCEIVTEKRLKSVVKEIIDFKPLNQVVVVCASIKSLIYLFDLNNEAEGPCDTKKLSFENHGLNFVDYYSVTGSEHHLYAFVDGNCIVKFDPSEDQQDLDSRINAQEPIIGLPEDINISGLVFMSKELCLLYSYDRVFKVDLDANKVINENADYRYIIKMDNRVLEDVNQPVLVELAPDDYKGSLPPVKPKRRFGQ